MYIADPLMFIGIFDVVQCLFWSCRLNPLFNKLVRLGRQFWLRVFQETKNGNFKARWVYEYFEMVILK